MKSKTKQPNIRLLRKIKAAILKRPNQFQMHWWFDDNLTVLDKNGDPIKAKGCGTAACIAGWAVHLGTKSRSLKRTQSLHCHDAPVIASKLLRLSENEILFHTGRWPQPFRSLAETAKTPKAYAQNAADRIGHFIKTGK